MPPACDHADAAPPPALLHRVLELLDIAATVPADTTDYLEQARSLLRGCLAATASVAAATDQARHDQILEPPTAPASTVGDLLHTLHTYIALTDTVLLSRDRPPAAALLREHRQLRWRLLTQRAATAAAPSILGDHRDPP